MAIKKTLGGDRLGSGRKMETELKDFGRSSHDVGMVFTTDQSAGTLIPCFCQIGTKGTKFYIDLESRVRTEPTVGPLFGSFKHQIDVFKAPIRLYCGPLHNNALGVGLKMSQVKMPKFAVPGLPSSYIVGNVAGDNPFAKVWAQNNLMSYLGVRGPVNAAEGTTKNTFGAFMAMYWEIYKNYYANKQEEIGAMIGGAKVEKTFQIITWSQAATGKQSTNANDNRWAPAVDMYRADGVITMKTNFTDYESTDFLDTKMYLNVNGFIKNKIEIKTLISQYGFQVRRFEDGTVGIESSTSSTWEYIAMTNGSGTVVSSPADKDVSEPVLKTFPLTNIDATRENILAKRLGEEYVINGSEAPGYPYTALTEKGSRILLQDGGYKEDFVAAAYDQCGLGLKTYQSDLFNNWLSTEWIDGQNGINDITAVDVSDGKLSMDDLILQKKMYEMLNRIAISGGSYDDWEEAVYGIRANSRCESPVFCGGMSQEIVFEEVVSSSAAASEPLGSLAGRGRTLNRKGGHKIEVECDEAMLVMVIESITPRITYSQGNKWWGDLDTMDDLHKPDLDGIAFQGLPEIWAAASARSYDNSGKEVDKLFGKQMSWQEYMTNYDESFGNFAAGNDYDFMVLNRDYEIAEDGTIADATTYIDPVKCTKAFAMESIETKPFWVQIGIDCVARRVMSAKQIPNL